MFSLRDRPADIRIVEETIRKYLSNQRVTRTHDKRKSEKFWIKIIHTSRDVRESGVRKIMHRPDIAALHPDPEEVTQLAICDKLEPTVGHLVCNHTATAFAVGTTNLGDSLPEATSCACQQLRASSDHHEVDGHVVALDASFLSDSHLAQCFQMGSKYRLNRHPSGLRAAINQGFNRYIQQYVDHNAPSPDAVRQLHEWKTAILEECMQNIRRHRRRHGRVEQQQTSRSLNRNQKESLSKLQQDFVVCPVDKAGHNLAIVCKHWYAYKLKNEMQRNDGAYQQVSSSPQEILRQQQDFNEEWGYGHHDAFAYLYGIIKKKQSTSKNAYKTIKASQRTASLTHR